MPYVDCDAPGGGQDPLRHMRVRTRHPGRDRPQVKIGERGGVEIAAQVVTRLGRPEGAVRRVVLDDDRWVAEQVAHGTPENMARFLPGFYQAAREGRFAGTDPLLGDLLGRQPRTVRDLLAERPAA